MKAQRLIIVSVLTAFVVGCATRYVERDVNKSEVTDNFGDVVVSQTSDALKKSADLLRRVALIRIQG